VLFRDFYKPVKNLFSNNYNDDKVILKAKTKPNKNLELSFETKREKGKDYAAKLAWTGNFKVQDASIKVEGEVLQVGEVSEKATIKGLYDGLTLEGGVKLLTEKSSDTKPKSSQKDEDDTTRDQAHFGLTYNHKFADANLQLTKKALNPFLLYGGLALKYEEFSFGGDFEYEFKERKQEDKLFKSYNFGATLQTDNLLLAAIVEKSFTNAKIGVQHKVDNNTEVGVEFSHKIDKTEHFVVQAGISRKLDDQSNIRAKLLSTGFATVAYQVKVKPDLTTTVSFETSAKELSSAGKIGVELAFEPLD